MPNLSVLCITPFIADLLLKSLSLPCIACIICHGQFFSISLRPLISYSMEKFVSHALELQFLILTYKRLPNLRSTKTSNAKFIFFFHGCHMILVVLHMNLDYFICMSKENPSCGNNFERHFFSSWLPVIPVFHGWLVVY